MTCRFGVNRFSALSASESNFRMGECLPLLTAAKPISLSWYFSLTRSMCSKHKELKSVKEGPIKVNVPMIILAYKSINSFTSLCSWS